MSGAVYFVKAEPLLIDGEYVTALVIDREPDGALRSIVAVVGVEALSPFVGRVSRVCPHVLTVPGCAHRIATLADLPLVLTFLSANNYAFDYDGPDDALIVVVAP